MAGNEFIGHQPSGVRWSLDGQSILFEWNKYNQPGNSSYSYSLKTKSIDSLTPKFYETRNEYENGKTYPIEIYAWQGNLYRYDRASKKTEVILKSASRIRNVQRNSNQDCAFFQDGMGFFVYCIEERSIKQLVQFKKGKKDKETELNYMAKEELELFQFLQDEKEAKQIATKREQLQREQGVRTKKHITLEEIGRRLAIGDFKELNVIVKGDVDGSIEALTDSLIKLSTEEIAVNVIHKAVGAISESDVLLASASDAIIIGFQVRPTGQARKLAESEEIDIRLYSIIYKAIEEMKDAMEGMLSPDIVEEVLGTAEVRDIFKISKVGTIAGSYVLEGMITRNSKVRLIRDGIVIYNGKLATLKRFKDDVIEVKFGYECGMALEKFNDLQVGDQFEAYHEVEVAKKLK